MFKFIWNEKGQYFFAEHNPSIRADKFGNVYGGGGGSKAKAEEGISQAGATAYERGKMTPEEETQYRGSFDLGNLIQQLQLYQIGLAGAPSGYLSPTEQYLREGGELGQLLYGQTLEEARDPYAFYESTLQPQLELTEDFINRKWAGKGFGAKGAGMSIEDMGRAGVELAIKEAGARQNARANALARASGLTEYISGGAANRLVGLSNLYGRKQQYGLTAMGRQAGQAEAAAHYQAYPYQQALKESYYNPWNVSWSGKEGLGLGYKGYGG